MQTAHLSAGFIEARSLGANTATATCATPCDTYHRFLGTPSHSEGGRHGSADLANLQLAWDLYAVSHSPAAKGIRKIKRLIPDEITRGSGQIQGGRTGPTQRKSRQVA